MSSIAFSIEQILVILKESPPRLVASTAGLGPEQLHTAAEAGEWSANEVLAHLRSCSDMWGESIARILTEDHPTFKAVNPTTWIKQTDYPQLEFHASLQAFCTQRAELLALLEPLPNEAWSRSATVMVAGKPSERTVLYYAQWLARHERPHVNQIEKIVSILQI